MSKPTAHEIPEADEGAFNLFTWSGTPWYAVEMPAEPPKQYGECECGQKGIEGAKHSDYCPLYDKN